MAGNRLDQDEIQQQLDALKQEYAKSLPGKISDLQQAWDDYEQERSADNAQGIESKLHKLAGSSGVFGYSRLGEEASKLESIVLNSTRSDAPLSAEVGRRIAKLNDYASIDVAPIVDQIDTIRQVIPLSLRPIYVVDDDKELLSALKIALQQRGYDVKAFDSIANLDEAVVDESPGLVVMDMAFPEGRLAGAEKIKMLSERDVLRVPTIFVSEHDDLAARLASVRAGSDAYLVKPLDFDDMCHQIDVLVSRHWQEPYRVLIVDDDKELAEHYGAMLKTAGADIAIVNNPLEIMSTLVDFRPDVIILDLHMPECSGMELADVLRQHEGYRHLPLIFFSTEADMASQLEARIRGADDFIVKSIQPREFVKVVLNRAQRARSMFTMLGTEPMTGLLNQKSFKEELENQAKLVAKANGLSALAFVDLDNFKQVNDKFGHLVGDAVIKQFAKFLQANLRRSDICARYGGEEFAVLMPGAGVEQAAEKLDSLRRDFAEVVHPSAAGEFSVSFSAGVIPINLDDGDISVLMDKVDKTLYEAKAAGRNQVKVAL